MAILSHYWELEDQPSTTHPCLSTSEGGCILGKATIGVALALNTLLLKSSVQKANIHPILHWEKPVLGRFWSPDGQPSIRNHCQEVSEEYCILGMVIFGRVLAELYVLMQKAQGKRKGAGKG